MPGDAEDLNLKFKNQVEAKKRAILQAVSGATTATNSVMYSHDSISAIRNPESSGHSDKKKKKKKHHHENTHHDHHNHCSSTKKDKKKKKHKKHKKSSKKHHHDRNGIVNFDTSLGQTNSGLSGRES